jgi:hypothetical protein
MGLVVPTIEAYQVQHLPIVKAYADKIGLVEAINAVVPTEMAIDPGTIVLGMILDMSGRSSSSLGGVLLSKIRPAVGRGRAWHLTIP